MNTFTNSTVVAEYAKAHSAELRLVAHLANGGYVLTSPQSSPRFERLSKQISSIKYVLQQYVVSLAQNRKLLNESVVSNLGENV